MADLSKIKLNGTEYDIKDAVARAAIGNALQIEVVQTLPTENIDTNTLYLVPREEVIVHSETKEVTSATTIAATFTNLATNLQSTYTANITITQILNEVETELLDETIDNISFNVTEATTIYNEGDWAISIPSQVSLKVTFSGDTANWQKDSWSVELTLIEQLPENNLYDEYIYVNNDWEKLNENSNSFMVKGVDYVTAGQMAGSTLGRRATTEGNNTIASGSYSHAEGSNTQATGNSSHAEGSGSIAEGNYSHTEGRTTKATGGGSHAEGYATTASGTYSHAEGTSTIAEGNYAHAEGQGNWTGAIKVTGDANATTYNFTWGNNNAQVAVVGQTVQATINSSTVVTTITAIDKTNLTVTFANTLDSQNAISNVSVGIRGRASGSGAHVEGQATTASNNNSHAEGVGTVASGGVAHAEGYATLAKSGQSHAEGYATVASNANTHAEGYATTASGNSSHAEGVESVASGISAHAEGNVTTASNSGSHSEGCRTTASGLYAHAEGLRTLASDTAAHAEGADTVSSGLQSHAEGWSTTASGPTAHTEGQFTIASKQSQHVFGEANIEDTGTGAGSRGSYVEIVGNGTVDTSSDTPAVTRSNARTLDWSGNEWLAGKLTVGTGPTNNMDVTTKQYVDNAVNNVEVPTVETYTNVITMLTNYGLNTTTTLEPAVAGSAETGTAVVQADEEEEQEGEGE